MTSLYAASDETVDRARGTAPAFESTVIMGCTVGYVRTRGDVDSRHVCTHRIARDYIEGLSRRCSLDCGHCLPSLSSCSLDAVVRA